MELPKSGGPSLEVNQIQDFKALHDRREVKGI